jgi:hypothetical protein
MQIFLNQACGMQTPQHGYYRTEYGQCFAIPRLVTSYARPGFDHTLGGIEKGCQQRVSSPGHRHRGDQFGGWYAGQDQGRKTRPFLLPVLFAATPNEQLGKYPTALQFRLADQPLPWQHTQQSLHAELTAIGERYPERQSRMTANCLKATSSGERSQAHHRSHRLLSASTASPIYSRPSKNLTILTILLRSSSVTRLWRA